MDMPKQHFVMRLLPGVVTGMPPRIHPKSGFFGCYTMFVSVPSNCVAGLLVVAKAALSAPWRGRPCLLLAAFLAQTGLFSSVKRYIKCSVWRLCNVRSVRLTCFSEGMPHSWPQAAVRFSASEDPAQSIRKSWQPSFPPL